MAKLVFGLNQSLDGYVDHQEFAPGPSLFRHWIEQVRGLSGSVYGRRMYEVMRYWDEDRPEWEAEERDFAAAWRSQPKWVVSSSLKSVGPNATLVDDDIEAVIRGLKAQLVGEIQVGGPDLARSLTDLGLIDEYQLYFRPVVLGRGKPFLAGPRPPLRLVASDLIGEDAIRLTYVPALITQLARRTAPTRQVRFGSLADIGEGIRDVRFTPEKRTCSSSASMSAMCHERTLRSDSAHGLRAWPPQSAGGLRHPRSGVQQLQRSPNQPRLPAPPTQCESPKEWPLPTLHPRKRQ